MFKRLYREFLYVPKYEKLTDDAFCAQIKSSVVTMLVCCMLLTGTTFAWFTSNQVATVNPVSTANYTLTVLVNDLPVTADLYTCPLATKDEHTFTITATGTASTGYCLIKVGDTYYSTVAIPKGGSIKVTIEAAQGTQISFYSRWGTELPNSIKDGDTLEFSYTPGQEYTVVEGVDIEQVSEHYQIPEDDILRYNGISELTAGETIRIPNTTVTEALVIQEKNEGPTTEPQDPEAQQNTEETKSDQP